MAETDPENTGADVREAPNFRRWRKDKGSDGLKMRTLRAMKAAEAMMYSAETREEAAEAIRLLTQAANSHRRVLRDEHRKEMETREVLTATQVQNVAVNVAAAAHDTFDEYEVPAAAQEALAERLDGVVSPPEPLDE